MPRGHAFIAFLVCALALAFGTGAAGAQAPVTLRVVFPEGFSARQMTDRVAEVRRIAIRKRGVTPRAQRQRLQGGARRDGCAQRVQAHLKRRSVEGFLFPSLYEFTPSTTASELIADQTRRLRAHLAHGGPAEGSGAQP